MSHLLLDGSKGTALGQLPHSLGRIILPTPSPGSGHPIFSFTLLSYGPSVFCFADIVGGVCVCVCVCTHACTRCICYSTTTIQSPKATSEVGLDWPLPLSPAHCAPTSEPSALTLLRDLAPAVPSAWNALPQPAA